MFCYKISSLNIIKISALITFTFILTGFTTIVADAATYTDTKTCTLSLQITNWNRSCSVPRFDPTIGVLQSVRFELSANIDSIASVESRDMSATTVTTNVSANITLLRPDNSIITAVIPSTSTSTNFTPYDGTTDFTGTSGAVLPNLLASEVSIITSSSLSDLALFSGSGNIITPVTASGLSSFTGSANLATLVDTQAAASINVIYSYLAQDLSISKTHAGFFTAGSQGVYNLTVTNKESTPTTGTITVVDTLPAGLSFVSNSNPDWSCASAGQVLTCTSSVPIAANGTSAFSVTVDVENSTLSTITNTARVSSTLPDPIPGDDFSDDPTTVNHLPTVSNTTVSPITPNTTTQLAPTIFTSANPNDISDSIVGFTITGLPDALVGIMYLGDPNSGGVPITNGQVLSLIDVANIYFTSLGNANASTTFTYTATDGFGAISSTSAIVNLNIQNNTLASSPTVIATTPTTAANPNQIQKSNIIESAIVSSNSTQSTISPLVANQLNKSSVLGVNDSINPSTDLIRTGETESHVKYFWIPLVYIIFISLYLLSIRPNKEIK